MVQLVQTGDELAKDRDFTYLILSYCWGKGASNSNARTTSSNLQSRLAGLDIETLPKTIQDAIFLTRLMRVKYLWVDATCIVQPEGPHDRGDWEAEADKMGDYYSNALCCIAASCASSSEDGFLRPVPLGRYKLQEHIVPFMDKVGDEDYMFTELEPALDGSGTESYPLKRMEHPLMKRGWCLQERILSPCVLHWTWAGLFKECRSTPPPAESERDGTAVDKKHILSLDKSEALGRRWFRLVEEYSRMDLTYPSDRCGLYGV
ncbi:hypothetical protein FPHYL_11318 [Fusarium phyllophilum]|uniref:Heterokaryon incompatibility domain-containing protein n=1 Tax=Fusarium phyllophilum TaxID=47803 RepID=A0A8H5MWF3_9HYPO|nr:hypothetical protein FPHYL_11318 [Fusarium phyllophilum]